jgi:dipeptidyl aminopeptidase/acylaminoacyl peptidase
MAEGGEEHSAVSKRRIAVVLALSAGLAIATALALGWFEPGWDYAFLAAPFFAGFLGTRPVRWFLGGIGRRLPQLVTWLGGPSVVAVGVLLLREAEPELFTTKRLVLGLAVLAAAVVLGVLGEFRPQDRWYALPGFWIGFAATTAIWCLVYGGWSLFFGWSIGVVTLVLLGIAAVDLIGGRLAQWLSPRVPWEAFLLLGVGATVVAFLADWGAERRERKAIVPVSNGAIAYLRSAPGGRVAVDAVGGVEDDVRAQTLIASVKPQSSVSWSPRGRRLAFVRGDKRAGHVWMYDVVTGTAVRVTTRPGDYDDPAWSPDGSRIAYTKRDPDRNSDIYVSPASRLSSATRLTNEPMSDVEPTWSPDGDQIAFASNRTGQYDIYVMAADGTRVARLTRGPRYSAPDRQPAWSPNGRTLAFVSRTTPGQKDDIYLVEANGRGVVTNLTRRATASSTDPAWSPDASEIVFTRVHEGARTLFRAVVQGPDDDDFGHTEEVKGAAGPSFAPAWKPLPDPDMPAHWYRGRRPATPGSLARRYAPLVRLHRNEKYWPMGASEFIRISRLEWRGCEPDDVDDDFDHPPIESKLGGGERPGDTADAYAIRRAECSNRTGEAFVHDRTRPRDTDDEGFVLVPERGEPRGLAPTVGARGAREPKRARRFISPAVPVYYEYVPGRSLTYWMFYGFSATEPAGRIGEHQGDWERITVCLDPDERPVSVVYHRHNTNRARSWTLVPKFGTHPVVYSAQGSHAAYPSAGTNPVLGTFDKRDEGPIWATWTSVRSVLRERWYGYGGSWGIPPGPDGPSRFKVGDEGC